jgi:RHS repeat-associated protein
VREFYNLVGNTVRVRTQGFDGSYLNQDTVHRKKGGIWRTSEPFFDGDSVEWNTNSHDSLGRVIGVAAADPVNSITTVYDGFSVAVTDAQNRTKSQQLNAIGQVIEVIDELGTKMAITYDTVGNRTRVTNAVDTSKQNYVTYSYDRLGRMLTQDDPSHGVYTYTYDALGQKLSEISPKMAGHLPLPQQIAYTYDLLGRMTSRSEPEGTTTWTFDNTASGNLGIGQLHSESGPGITRTYAYDSNDHGRLTAVSTTINGAGAPFTTAMSYNSNGQIATETYPASISSPGGFQVEYTYNALGFQERVQAPGGGTVYYQLLATDAAGRTTSEWLGDGSIANQVYEAASSRVVDQHTTSGGTDIQHFSYTYDDAGNMTSRGDVRLGLSEAFTFDDLDRLTSGQVAGGTTSTYDFDVVGNITEKSDSGSPYLYTGSSHAVTQIITGQATQNLSYDPNGNLSTGDDVPTITWSSYNKPTQLTKGSITYSFTYGPDRTRYKKTHSNGDTTYYIGTGFERINKYNSTEYRHIIRANGRAVMLRKDYSAGGVSHEYVHRDHLGSVTALTRESDGSVIERYSYDAWGMRRNPTTWAAGTITAYEPRGYTGHEHLDDIGIIHMNGRVYDPRLGRMLSPDPVTQAPENGQNYNRYSYGYNNPLTYTDPTGYESKKKTVLVDGNSAHSAGRMEYVYVVGRAPPSGRVTDNQAALVHSGTGGNNSPRSEPGDRPEQSGQVVENIQTAGGIDCNVADCTPAELNEPRGLAGFLRWLNNQWAETKSCRNDCLAETFGEAYLVASDLSILTTVGVVSGVATEVSVNVITEYVEEPVLRELHDESAAIRQNAILRRRAIALIRSGNGIVTLVGATAALVEGSAVTYCEVKCYYD